MKMLHISQVDSIFANGSYPIEFLFFYRHGLKNNALRTALAYLSGAFWPLFGIYEDGFIRERAFDADIHLDETIRDELFDPDMPKNEIHQHFNAMRRDVGDSLLHLNLIQYHNGTILIVRMNHLAGDGYSFFYFLSVLAAITRSGKIPFQKQMIRLFYGPHHARTIVREFPPAPVPGVPLPRSDVNHVEYIQLNKSRISDTIVRHQIPGKRNISANDYLSALVLQKTIEFSPSQFSDKILLNIPVDVRRSFKEYGAKFIGNALFLHTMEFKIAAVMNAKPEELARQIRDSIPVINKERYNIYLDELDQIIIQNLTEQLVPYNPDTGCLVTNLSRMPVTRLNFGWGPPDLIFTLTVAKNSAVILAENNFHVLRLAL